MTKENQDSGGPAESSQRLITSPAERAKAQKWFDRARELGEKRQFDYAIEYYINGLEFWPDAVEEACKPLHGCGVARRQTGGKKAGIKDQMKRSQSDKDPKKALLNSLWLFGHEPDNYGYIESVARNASRLRAEDTAKWASGVALKALETAPKPTSKQFQQLVEVLEELGDRASVRAETAFGVEAYTTGVEVLNLWRRKIPKDTTLTNRVKNLSTKLTILKGKYEKGDSYRDSMADGEKQAALHDEDRSVQSEERVDELILAAEKSYEESPDQAGALKRLIDLLCRREIESDEVKAIGFLVNHYKRTDDYRWKQLADDIRIRQLARRARQLRKSGDADNAREEQVKQLTFELSVFKERFDRYPTDYRIRFEYGVRLFRAGRFDDAIPLLQAARNDPKNRIACGLYLGRCFYRKGYFSEAIAAFDESIRRHDAPDDDLAKDLHYWLGRTQEDAGRHDEARKTYGQILQMDYNFRDVRDRLDALPAAGG